MVLMNVVILFVTFWLNIKLTIEKEYIYGIFKEPMAKNPGQFAAAAPAVLQSFCPDIVVSKMGTF